MSNVADTLAALPPCTDVGSPVVQQSIEALGHCCSTTQNIISDVLDFERIDSGQMVLVPQEFRLAELMRGSECLYSAHARQRKVRLHFEMPTGELDSLMLTADVRRLQQVLNNGISNRCVRPWLRRARACDTCSHAVLLCAKVSPLVLCSCVTLVPLSPSLPFALTAWQSLKFTDVGGLVTVHSRLSSHTTAGWVRVHLTVTDNGIGLCAEELRLLNDGDAFAQVGRGQMQGNGGTGLGLKICKHLLELHAGSQLMLWSEGLGKGTTFEMIVACPARHAPSSAQGALVRSSSALFTPAGSEPRFAPGFRILYAEVRRLALARPATGHLLLLLDASKLAAPHDPPTSHREPAFVLLHPALSGTGRQNLALHHEASRIPAAGRGDRLRRER